MDPFVTTIVKESGVILLGFVAGGLLVAALVGVYKYAQLQHALTLNITPPAVL